MLPDRFETHLHSTEDINCDVENNCILPHVTKIISSLSHCLEKLDFFEFKHMHIQRFLKVLLKISLQSCKSPEKTLVVKGIVIGLEVGVIILLITTGLYLKDLKKTRERINI